MTSFEERDDDEDEDNVVDDVAAADDDDKDVNSDDVRVEFEDEFNWPP